MKHSLRQIAFALAGLLALSAAAIAQVPPQPPGYSVLGGSKVLAASGSSSRTALPASTTAYGALTLYNSGSVDVNFALGGSTVTADTSGTCVTNVGPSCVVPAGKSITVWAGSNTYIAAITASSTASLYIYQGNGPLGMNSGGGGGGGASCTFANPTATIGASAVNGSATTCMRSDAAPPLPATLPALSGVNLTALNGSNIASGTVAAARGGAGTISGALKGNGSGVVTQAACADLSNAAASCSTDATNAANISSGNLPVARISNALTAPGAIGGTTPAAGSFTTLSATSTLTTNVTGGGTQCVQASNTGVISGTGAACPTGTGTVVYGQYPISSQSSFAAGFSVCVLNIVPNNGTISSIGVVATGASASTNWRGGVYDDLALVVNNLQNQSNLVNGIVKGQNVVALTSAYTNSSGNPKSTWMCVITDTAAFNIGTFSGGNGALLWNQGSSTFPSTAPTQSADSHTWAIFGIGKAGS